MNKSTDELQSLVPESTACVSYLYWELSIPGGTEAERCSVLLVGLLHNLDKIQLLPHSESLQKVVTQPLPDFSGRINPPPRKLAGMGM